MKEHIKQLADEYVADLAIEQMGLSHEELEQYAKEDFTAGINRVLQHPEEFGLQAKEYE